MPGDLALLLLVHVGAEFEPEFNVPEHAQPGKRRIGLEDHTLLAVGPPHPFAVEAHLAEGRALQPADDAHQGRLAATRGPDEDDEVVLLDADGNIVDHLGRWAAAIVVEPFRDAVDFQEGYALGHGLAYSM